MEVSAALFGNGVAKMIIVISAVVLGVQLGTGTTQATILGASKKGEPSQPGESRQGSPWHSAILVHCMALSIGRLSHRGGGSGARWAERLQQPGSLTSAVKPANSTQHYALAPSGNGVE